MSHRTDKSWHREPRDQPHLVPYSGEYSQGQTNRGYQPGPSSHVEYRPGPSSHVEYRQGPSSHGGYRQGPSSHVQYPPSRPSYSSGRPASRPQSPSATSSTSSSSDSEEDSDQTGMRGPMMPPHGQYSAYPSYYPGGPGGYPPGYSSTMKPAKSMPTLATWDGEPCPVHGGPPPLYPPMLPPGPPMLPPPSGPMTMPHPGGHMTLPHPGMNRRSNSIYDMRMMMPPPPAPIYGTLPARPPPSIAGDRRSVAGSLMAPSLIKGSTGIPPQLLPPMARPRPIVVSEDGVTEPLPVRAPIDKHSSLPPDVAAKVAAESTGSIDLKQRICCRGAPCVAWVILAVICIGILLTVMLRFIL